MLVFLYTKVLKQLGSIALSLPSVHLGKLQLQVGSTVAVFLGHLFLRVEALALLHVFPKRLVTHQDGVHDAELIIFEVVLLQYREALA